MAGVWDHLEEPFMPGHVIPSNRAANGWHFTFVAQDGNEYHNSTVDWGSASEAKKRMRIFCAIRGNMAMKQLVREMYGMEIA